MRRIFTLSLILFVAAPNIANELPYSLIEKNQQQNQQQFKQLQLEKQQEWLQQHSFQKVSEQSDDDSFSTQCLPYDELAIIGVTLIETKAFAPVKNECLSSHRLNQLSRDLTAAYIQAGYMHTPFQFEDDGSRVLRMKVTEGKVTNLTTSSKRLNLSMLFPKMLHLPLKIADLDQGLDQAMRLSSSNVSIDVIPEKSGEIKINLSSQDYFPVTGKIILDNEALKKYGAWQLKTNMNIDNLFRLSDVLSLNLASTLKHLSNNYSRSASLYHSIPYGYWTFSSFGSYSYFKSIIPLQYNQALQKGYTWQFGIRGDYTFHRGSNHISSVAIQLERLDSQSKFNNVRLVLQSPKLTTAQVNLNHLQLFHNSSLSFNLSYERGLKWFNALPSNDHSQPQGQFNKWNIDLDWQRYFKIKDEYLFRHSHQLSGQYSSQYLPSSKQVDLLGKYAVIGFKENVLSADKQLLLKNTLSWLYSQNNWNIEPFLQLHIGVQQTNNENSSNRAWGYGIGVKTQMHKLNAEIHLSKGKAQEASHYFSENTMRFSLNYLF